VARTAEGLVLDVGEIPLERFLVDGSEALFTLAPGIVRANDVVGDAEHVEAVASIQVDELGDAQCTVAPVRVGMKLAEQRTEAPTHTSIVAARPAAVWEKVVDFQERR